MIGSNRGGVQHAGRGVWARSRRGHPVGGEVLAVGQVTVLVVVLVVMQAVMLVVVSVAMMVVVQVGVPVLSVGWCVFGGGPFSSGSW